MPGRVNRALYPKWMGTWLEDHLCLGRSKPDCRFNTNKNIRIFDIQKIFQSKLRLATKAQKAQDYGLAL